MDNCTQWSSQSNIYFEIEGNNLGIKSFEKNYLEKINLPNFSHLLN